MQERAIGAIRGCGFEPASNAGAAEPAFKRGDVVDVDIQGGHARGVIVSVDSRIGVEELHARCRWTYDIDCTRERGILLKHIPERYINLAACERRPKPPTFD